jgi:hypothetical protein
MHQHIEPDLLLEGDEFADLALDVGVVLVGGDFASAVCLTHLAHFGRLGKLPMVVVGKGGRFSRSRWMRSRSG